MKKMKRKIPNFKNEDEEREFWAIHSPLDYFDSKKFKRGSFLNLKPSLKSISSLGGDVHKIISVRRVRI